MAQDSQVQAWHPPPPTVSITTSATAVIVKLESDMDGPGISYRITYKECDSKEDVKIVDLEDSWQSYMISGLTISTKYELSAQYHVADSLMDVWSQISNPMTFVTWDPELNETAVVCAYWMTSLLGNEMSFDDIVSVVTRFYCRTALQWDDSVETAIFKPQSYLYTLSDGDGMISLNANADDDSNEEYMQDFWLVSKNILSVAKMSVLRWEVTMGEYNEDGGLFEMGYVDAEIPLHNVQSQDLVHFNMYNKVWQDIGRGATLAAGTRVELRFNLHPCIMECQLLYNGEQGEWWNLDQPFPKTMRLAIQLGCYSSCKTTLFDFFGK